jgi:Notch-like protein
MSARSLLISSMVAALLALAGGCKDDLGLGAVVFECAGPDDCASGYVCRVDGSLGRSVCLPSGTVVPVLDGLNFTVTSDAPTTGGLTAVRAAFRGEVGGVTVHWPSAITDVSTSVAVGDGFAPVPGPAAWHVDTTAAPFGENTAVSALIVGVSATGIATAWVGTVDFSSSQPQAVHLALVPATCDADGDGFLDCAVTGCCGGLADSPLSDCGPGVASVHPFAAEDACAQCGDGVDQDCDGGDAGCVDDDGDGVADCVETCGGGDPAVAPGLPERCDSVDQDCDGQTDEGYPVGAPCGEGACAGGAFACGADALTTFCSTADKATTEVCDNAADDDCDGQTDEGCSDDDLDGDGYASGAGDCNDGDAGVHPGAAEKCCSRSLQGQPTALTVCDKDCDNAVAFCAPDDLDEDGYSPPADCDDTQASVYPSAPEVCGDGVDQDCADGDLTCSTIVDVDQDGYAAGVDCDDEDEDRNPGAAELCDAIDQDCDGETDEGNPGTNGGEACGETAGLCSAGARVCVNAAVGGFEPGTVVCLGGQGPQDEVCNDLDDDCDGATDEDFSVAGQPVGGVCDGIGACGEGVVECASAGAARCSTDPGGSVGGGATDESCNGEDDDCDGTVDEGLADFADSGCSVEGVCGATDEGGAPLATAACRVNPQPPESFGWDCDYGAIAAWTADEALSCDGLDNDCDGDTDDGLGLGTGCDGEDEDACDNGVIVCSEIDSIVWCDEGGAASAVEACDGKDNDCDDSTDEDFLAGGTVTYDGGPFPGDAGKGLGAGCGTGVCGGGLVECKPGAPQQLRCSSALKAAAEKCNGKDDDCDGKTDEAFPLGSTCGIGLCGGGVVECGTNGGTRCSSMPAGIAQGEPGSQSKATGEVCNGKDDDCDGKSDEELTSVADAGCSFLGVCGGEGVAKATCTAGKWLCSFETPDYQAGDELGRCDVLDNDCDGKTDEDFGVDGSVVYTEPDGGTATLGQACGVGACLGGKAVCAPDGQSLACTTADVAGPELCNGADDDCDGQTDDDVVAGPSSLCSTEGVCGQDGVLTVLCEGGVEQCLYSGPDYQPDSELGRCDQADNDCDGATDEDFAPGGSVWFETAGGQKLGLGQACGDGACGGVVRCAASGVGLECSLQDGGADDVCNGVDDDCDGVTDQAFKAGGTVVYDGGPWPGETGTVLADECGTGRCSGGLVVCGGETALTCDTLSKATGELCNSVDDDCNGGTDEPFVTGGTVTYGGGPFAADAGKALGKSCGTGVCSGGAVVCNAANPTALTCSTLSGAALEACDGKDNDCDGKTDEDFKAGGTVVYNGPLPTQTGKVLGDACGVGPCAGGTVVCNPAAPATLTCSTLTNATAETCDGQDQDCDAHTDEDFKASLGLVGWPQPYAPFGMRFLGESCGTGKCKGGFVVCSSGGGLECPTMALAAQGDATCDGIDENCNGVTDDAFAAGGSVTFADWDGAPRVKGEACGRGACGGKVVCESAATLGCDGAEPAPDTSCDGADQDCDGGTDEAFEEQPCDSGGDGCSRGVSLCSNASVVCDGDVPCPAQRPECVAEPEGSADTDTCTCTVDESGDSCTAVLGEGWACQTADGTCQQL